MSPSSRNGLQAKDKLLQFKQLIKQKDHELRQKFDPHQSVKDLLNENADFIDTILTSSWQYFLADQADKLCLIAVGGYARRELFPHSDIDLLILLDSDNVAAYQDKLTSFLTFLWDIGLKPGQSVRTIAESIMGSPIGPNHHDQHYGKPFGDWQRGTLP